MSSILFSISITLGIFVGYVAADAGDSVLGNLLTDLAPFLTLFAERPTLQSLGQIFGVAACISLAVGPIGIVHVMTAAIRVSNVSWLKACIGRSRENLAAVELEAMSSTSKEVSELWNGKEVVRCMGDGSLSELILLYPDTVSEESPLEFMKMSTAIKLGAMKEVVGSDNVRGPWVTMTIRSQEALGRLRGMMSRLYTIKVSSWTWSNLRSLLYAQDAQPDLEYGLPMTRLVEPTNHPGRTISPIAAPRQSHQPIVIVYNDLAPAPSLMINRQTPAGHLAAQLVAGVGLVGQLGLIVSVLVVGGGDRKSVIFSFGTALLVVGQFLCATIVKKSTTIRKYQPDQSYRAHPVWLQPEKIVNDQIFHSTALYPRNRVRTIMTSTRAPPIKYVDIFVYLGLILSAGGYLIQSIQFRNLDGWVQAGQCGLGMLVYALRTLAPWFYANPINAHNLIPGHELDEFVLSLAKPNNIRWNLLPWEGQFDLGFNQTSRRWVVQTNVTPEHIDEINRNDPEPDSVQLDGRDILVPSTCNAQGLLLARNALATLINLRGPASEEVNCLASAIEQAMAVFHPKPIVREGKISPFKWSLPVNFTGLIPECVEFRLDWVNGRWEACLDEIESALSMWLCSVKRQSNDRPRPLGMAPEVISLEDDQLVRGRFQHPVALQILGSCWNHKLIRDLAWFLPEDRPDIFLARPNLKKEELEYSEFEEVGRDRIIGNGFRMGTGFERTPFWACSKFNLVPEHDFQSRSLLVTKLYEPHEKLFAKHMFSAFMWSVVKARHGEDTFIVENPEIIEAADSGPESWKKFRVHSPAISKLAHSIQNTGFWSLRDVLLAVIPPLSQFDMLPKPDVVQLAHKKAMGFLGLNDWEGAKDAYAWCVTVGQSFFDTRYAYNRAIALTLELYLFATKSDRSWAGKDSFKDDLRQDLLKADAKVLGQLIFIRYRQQQQPSPVLKELEARIPEHLRTESLQFPNECGFTLDHELAGDIQDPNVKDIFDLTPLDYAVCRRDEKKVVDLLDHGADLNTGDLYERTPLHRACEGGHRQIALILIDEGARCNARSIDGKTPMHFAVHQNDAEMVGSLSTTRANTRIKDSCGHAPVHSAVIGGNLTIVKHLIRDADIQDGEGHTTFHLAVLHKKDQVLKLLIKNEAHKVNSVDSEGQTALHFAIKMGNLSSVRLLVSSANVKAFDNYNETPMHLAIRSGDIDVIDLLMQNGWNSSDINSGEMTLLHFAVKLGKTEVVEHFIAKGVALRTRNQNGETALHTAVEQGEGKIVGLLIDAGAGVDIHTLVMAMQGDMSILRLLIKDKDVNMDIDALGNRLLHLAIDHGSLDAIREILLAGAEVNARNWRSVTPLSLAIARRADAIPILLDYATDIHERAGSGLTAMHIAALSGSLDLAMRLYEGDPTTISARTQYGLTPRDMAESSELYDYLLEKETMNG